MLRFRKNLKGFTLLEIILVLVIIGFFAAMLAPKLAKVSDTADTTISSQNKRDIVTFTRVWQQEHTGLPNQMISLVNNVLDKGYQIPEVDDADPENGEEVLSQDFILRLRPYLHKLDTNEIAELKKMGVKYVMALNEETPNQKLEALESPMKKLPVDDPNILVLMIGAGHDGTAWKQGVSNGFATYAADTGVTISSPGGIAQVGNPEWMYRIIMGIGPDCSLVKDGTVSGAALNPGTGSKAKYQYYCMVLPRLKSTVTRLAGGPPATITKATADAGSGAQGEVKDNIRLDLPQEAWEFGIVGSDGKIWPPPKSGLWNITLP